MIAYWRAFFVIFAFYYENQYDMGKSTWYNMLNNCMKSEYVLISSI